MSIHYSEYLRVSHEGLTSKGVYNGCIDVDSKLHIDPLLLKNCKVPEFTGSYEEFLKYFEGFVSLTKFAKVANTSDRFFKRMVERFTFSEIPNTGLGYSVNNTKGTGISGALARQLATSAYEIISAGMVDPEIFALMQFIEDNIGADRISDMTISILYKRFISFTQRISKELSIKTLPAKYRGEIFHLPFFKMHPIIYIPQVILADLPLANSYEDIDSVCRYNNELKQRVAQVIGLSWQDYKEFKKRDWKNILMNNPDCYRTAISFYKGLTGVSYDFAQDGREQYSDILLKEFLIKHPLNFQYIASSNPRNDIYELTKAICIQFKHLVEDNRLSEIFYRKGRTPDETDWQLLLYTVADTYKKAGKFNVSITREDNPGVGEIDFHLTQGSKANTVIEIKRSGNKDLYHGYRTQLLAYMRAENATDGIFLVIVEDDGYETIKSKLEEIQVDMTKNGEYVPEIIFINGSKQPSASSPQYKNPTL